MGFEQSEYVQRITKLQKVLAAKEVDLVILTQNSDLYYYSGSVQPIYLVVPVAGEPIALARKAISRIKDEASGVQVEVFNNTKDLARIIAAHGIKEAQRIGFTTDTIAYGSVLRWLQLYPGASVVDLSWEIRSARIIKSEAEIAIQTRAGKIMAGIPRVITEGFKPGMTELELSVLVESYLRINGHGGFLRCRREGIETGMGVCSAGVNSLAGTKFDGICSGAGVSNAFPYGGTHQPIPKGEPVLVDFGYPLEGYHVDQTWMFGWGKQSEQVLRAFRAMVQVEQSIIEQLKPGNLWSEIYENAVTLAADLGYEAEFMGFGTEKVRFVGHGVGLELDEPPFLAPKMDYELAPGMVLAVEPKVMLPGVGVIGPEDTLVVRDSGSQLLTERSVEFLIMD
jgi:Xaa-Pro dipeptidase